MTPEERRHAMLLKRATEGTYRIGGIDYHVDGMGRVCTGEAPADGATTDNRGQDDHS